MTPGLTGWNTSITAGDVVAVTLQDKVPLAVGVAGFDIGRLSKAAGEKGKAVYLVHCYNDDLWSLGSKTRPPTSITPVADLNVEESMQQLSLDADVEDNTNIEPMQEPPEETNNSEKEPAVIEPSISGKYPLSVLRT
jgi:translation initiation factor 2D